MNRYFKDIQMYLKDNPDGYWFKRKLYGWGWVPATKKGWAVTFVALTIIIGNAVRVEFGTYTPQDEMVQVLLPTAVAVFVLLFVCFKTGESLQWQWGVLKEEGVKEEVEK